MAAEIVKDIDEKFCQCPICLEQFKEPKLLSCLHRFCKDCLAGMIQPNRGYIPCPVCREECIIPEEGLNGFKTDFYMTNMIEYVQLQTSLEDDHVQECYGCSKTQKVSAYCFKCNDFLCEACYQFHMNSKITKDHRPHTLAVKDVASKRLSLDKLASLKEAPRCFTHPEKLSEVCCKSCSNTPICMACTYGNHKGHDFCEVTALANEERGKLEQDLEELLSYEEKMSEVPRQLEKIRNNIQTVVMGKKKYLEAEHIDKKGRIEDKLWNLETKYKLEKDKKEEKLSAELSLLQKEMNEEVQKIREKYNKLCDEKRQLLNNELEVTHRNHDKHTSKLRENLLVLDESYKEATDDILTQQQENIQKSHEIAGQYEGMIKRFENLKSTTSTILRSMNDWTVVQCTPDIVAAKIPLLRELKKEIPQLDTLVEIKLKPLPPISLNERVSITSQAEFVLNVEAISVASFRGRYRINNITTTQRGRIVLTGNVTQNSSHITVIDEKGKSLSQDMYRSSNRRNPNRCCDFLSESTIVTACDSREFGLYDIDTNKYIQKNTRAETKAWLPESEVTCIASDIANNQIILGNFKCKHLYVFDRDLKVRRTVILPNPIQGCRSLAFLGSNLIVCDLRGKGAFAINNEGDILYEFMKPSNDRNDWKPISVCKDGRGFAYISWYYIENLIPHYVITQHSHDSGHLLAKKGLPFGITECCLATMTINEHEKLLVGDDHNQRIFIYGLVPQE